MHGLSALLCNLAHKLNKTENVLKGNEMTET